MKHRIIIIFHSRAYALGSREPSTIASQRRNRRSAHKSTPIIFDIGPGAHRRAEGMRHHIGRSSARQRVKLTAHAP